MVVGFARAGWPGGIDVVAVVVDAHPKSDRRDGAGLADDLGEVGKLGGGLKAQTADGSQAR